MIKKLAGMIFGREYGLRERIFRMIILVGGMLALLGIVECVMLMDVMLILLPILILLVVLVIELLITFKYRKIDMAAVIVALLILLLVFPTMFFLSGGLEGGASLWFALGLFYVFLMFSGKRMVFFLILSVIADAGTYLLAYCYPQLIMPMESRAAAYVDSLFAVLAVGIAGGAILKAQMKMFYIERSIARKQQKELEELSNAKSRFFANMSHEIRTPINTIVGLNEMILRESDEKETKDYARNIQGASKMLLNLINDILDLSQMEMQKMEIVPVEYKIRELFRELINMIQIRMKEKKLEFLIDIDENLPSVLWGDRKRISQVLLNILTNAAKYTDEGSVVFSAHVESISEETVYLNFSVSDTGIGIRKEELQHIYDSFKRADKRKNQRIEGSGLGLSIAKQFVDMMEGEITVDSIYMRGSVFTVVLPQKIIDGTPMGEFEALSGTWQETEIYQRSFEAPEARILIVDDNAANTMVESKLLEATRVQIDIAGDGAECLEMTKRKYYHVILMDYMMPGMNGVDVLRELRKQKNGLCRDSAVLVLSASLAAEDGHPLIEEGFDGYLEKPISGVDLEAGILKFLPEDIIEYRLKKGTEVKSEIEMVKHHKKRRVCITTDCVSDLPENLIEKYGIGLMYLYIRTESGRFADTWEISSDNISRYMTENTSNVSADTVSVEEYEEFFADMLTQAEQIIHISMAQNLGNSYEAAVTAAQSFDHVQVVDSSHISCGQALVALYAGRLANNGYKAEEICRRVGKMLKRIESQFIMPSVNIFCQRGKMNQYAAKFCKLCGFHPVFKMSQSRLSLVGVRGGKLEGAWRRFIRWHLLRKRRISTDVIFISHVGCTVEQQDFIRHEVLRCIPFKKVIMQRASVTLACNSGMGTFGLAYYVNVSKKDF